MRAVLLNKYGEADQLLIGETQIPEPDPNEILVKVHATALNRADILQREGKYPPPKGASELLGLEISGEVINGNNSQWQKGDKVFGLVPGGSYAEYCTIDQDMALSIPDNMTYAEAAAIPEAFLTAYQALVWHANIQTNEKVLIHAGASGVGSAAIQLAIQKGATCIVTASKPKHGLCHSLGAELCIDYRSEDFERVIKDKFENVDIIIDFLAASYFDKNINSLNVDGRLVLLAFLGGVKTEANLAKILTKRIKIIGSTLRSRPLSYQQKLTKEFAEFALPLLTQNKLSPVIDSVMNWEDIVEAHKYMEANKNKGKIVLKID